MTLRQIEVFLAVAKAHNFRRAAEALHCSQPALSQHVRDLEEEIGIRVFDRLGRTVVLTEAGRVIEEHALRVFATLRDMQARIAAVQGLTKGTLVVGASTTPGIYVLPDVIAKFRRRHPGIDVSLHIGNSRFIEERTQANEFDLGVIGGHVLGPGEECLAAGLMDELVLIVPPTQRWAGRRHIEPRHLIDEPLLMREEGSSTRQVTERTLKEHAIAYRVLMELGHIEAIKQAVMAGMGVAFVSAHAIAAEVTAKRLHPVRLKGVDIRRHFHVIHRAGRILPPAGQAFLSLVTGDAKTAGSGDGRSRPSDSPAVAATAHARGRRRT